MNVNQTTSVRKLWRDSASGAASVEEFNARFKPAGDGAVVGEYCGQTVQIDASGYAHLAWRPGAFERAMAGCLAGCI